jgi:hypothetical protein
MCRPSESVTAPRSHMGARCCAVCNPIVGWAHSALPPRARDRTPRHHLLLPNRRAPDPRIGPTAHKKKGLPRKPGTYTRGGPSP